MNVLNVWNWLFRNWVFILFFSYYVALLILSDSSLDSTFAIWSSSFLFLAVLYNLLIALNLPNLSSKVGSRRTLLSILGSRSSFEIFNLLTCCYLSGFYRFVILLQNPLKTTLIGILPSLLHISRFFFCFETIKFYYILKVEFITLF